MKRSLVCLCMALWLSLVTQVMAQETPSRTKLGEFARDYLTPEEKKWLIENPVIRYSADPDWPPFSFGDIQGRLWGIEADLLAAVSEKTGLKFEYFPHQNWTEIRQALLKGEIHFVPGVARSAARDDIFLFTEKYWNFPVVIITRKDEPFYKSVESLTTLRLVMPKEHVSTEHILRHYPEVKFTQTDTTAQALEAVARHKADATIDNLAAASYIIRNMRYNNLKVSGLMSYDFAGHLAMPKDQPILRSILQKALDQVGTEEKERIFRKWTTGEVEGAHVWHTSIQRAKSWGYFLGAILIVSVFWIVLLQIQIRERKKAQHLLEEAHARLQKINEQKNRNIGIVAHDLRGPLTHLTLTLELMKDQAKAQPGMRNHSIDELLSSVAYMETSINNLLDIHKIEQGTVTIKKKPLDLIATLQNSIRRMEPAAAAKSISIHRELWPDSSEKMMVSADSHALSHVVDNLLSNAVKYSPEKSVVTVRISRGGDQVLLAITDEGAGVASEEVPRLFEPFSRLSSQPTGGESSTGLGLSIVKYFVEKMGGAVSYQKGPEGKGACFTVSLSRGGEDGT